ncbi:MAG: SusC/RagA family TonB-linked outer membrane protein [Porphyromonadaceae bacterium]|nr:MAG: SusC/RagA family TonB-linked outer membrane protein [Porphyromonadaceae bacterium]
MRFNKKCSGLPGLLLLVFLIFIGQFTLAQNAPTLKISGIVRDNANSDPIPGVNVSIKGTQTGSVTDNYGKYSINVQQGATLVFSYVGYENSEIQVGSQQNIDIRLDLMVHSLDGVVVIGYGTTTKKEVTGSIATVKSGDFNRGAFGDAMGLLQGKVAGLTIVKPDGADPQAGYRIMLRGTNTLTSGQGPLIIIDGVVGADIKNVSAEEIESFDVLKDGAAAAIYGTRGSNGVIIITTRRAKAGLSKVEYTGQYSAQVAPRGVKNLSASEFRQAIELYQPDKAINVYGDNVNWFKEISRPVPFSQKHNLAISGGSENFSHRTTFYADNAQGLLKDNVSNRYLIRTNIAQKVLGDLLLLDYNLSYSMRDYKPANYDLCYQAFIRNPTSPIYDPGNTYSGGYTLLEGIEYYNPVAMQKERTRQGKTTDTGGNVRATLNLFGSLKWVNFISIEQADWEDLYYRTKYYPSKLGKNGEAEISNGWNNNLQYESTFNYLKSFKDHNLQALAGYSFQELESNNSYMINSGFDSDLYGPNNIGDGSALGVGTAEMGSYKEKSRLISFFGRVMYNYDQKYLASVSLRREGSSRFGKNNKWGWFPSVSLGWRLNKEGFMTNVKWVNDLKLRIGYGVTGNQDFANYQSLIMMGTAGKFFYNGEWINTYQPTSNPNPDLRWEKKQELNAGVDFSFFNNRISGFLDYYNRTSTDLLYTYNVPYPPYIFPVLFTNVGTIRNEGVELTMNVVPVKRGFFTWMTTMTFSKNSNKLVKFSNDEFTSKYIETGWLGGAFPLNALRIEEGKSLGTFYGPVWLGVNEDGYDLFKNANPIGKVDPKDWEPIGNAYPFCTIGWSNMLSFNGWDLNFSFRSNIGGQVLNMYRLYYENWQSLGRNIVHTQLENPRFIGNGQYSSKYVESATFLKLDNVSIGYNVPVHSKYISKIRLNITAQDVFTISGYKGLDPEVNLSGLQPGIEYLYYYPRTTAVTLGVNVLF